jgi:membrane fusion protein, copper/silver efflux system
MKITKKEIWFAIGGLLIGLLIYLAVSQLISISTNQHISTSADQHISTSATYTCSMHPQIRQDEPGKCPICGMNLIPVSAQQQISKSDHQHISMSPEAFALANVQTQKVKTVSPEHEVYLTGKVAVNEQRLAVITANFSGRIEKLFIDFTGQPVHSGQKLVTIYSPGLVTAQKDINPALYNAAKEKLRLWKITDTQISEIENSGVVLTEFDVYSDQSGIVIRRDISKGDYVNQGTVLFEIADLSKVWVLLDAYESDLPFIKTGQKITITLASVPGKEFTSTISFIDPLINPQTRTASVRAELDNPQQMLKPEMFVKGKVTANISTHQPISTSIVIPKTSLLWTGKRSVVYVKVPDSEFPAFEMKEITLGASLGEYYIVESGLSEGEEIVTNGVFAIDAAAQLSGNYSMMSRPVSKRISVPADFQAQLTTLANQYFNLKNNLVEGDYKKAGQSAASFLRSLDQVDMKSLDDRAHEQWMEHQETLRTSGQQIAGSTDLEQQRVYFESVSNRLIESVEMFGLTLDEVYVAYCPMAFDNKGAYWLSEFKEIRNPYFGDAMLKCGEVRQTFTKKETHDQNRLKVQEGHQH